MTTNPQEILPSSLSGKPGQRWLILGLGREGRSSFNYLAKLASTLGAELWLADERAFSEVAGAWPEIEGFVDHYLELGDGNPIESDFEVIIKTPGIPKAKLADQFGLKWKTLTSNTGLFFELIKANNQRRSEPILTVGVTGTKGKSTTTALTHQVLSALSGQDEEKVLLAGNIGVPALDLSSRLEEAQIIVLELSSHQLADLAVSPRVALVQTIVPEHQDHFESFDDYWSAKANIVKFQSDDDLVIYFADNPDTAKLANLSRGRKLSFGRARQPELPNQVGWLEEDRVLIKTDRGAEPVVELGELKLVGRHNLINVLPSLCLVQHLGLDLGRAAAAARAFAGLPHRLQLVAVKNEISYYNDTLATNPAAASAALASFPKGKVILLAGGYDRHPDYSPFAKLILEQEVKQLIFFPPSGQVISGVIKKIAKTDSDKPTPPPETFVESMAEAVRAANQVATSGDIVLLSPGSASFGLFKDYADRGEQFIEEVKKL